MALQRQVDPEDMNREKQQNGSDSESQSSMKKRRRDNDDDDIVLSPEILAKMSRSERKRHREKKRRSDVNKGFDDLMNLLLEIDPVVRAEAEDRARRGQWKGNLGAQEENLLSRVELIGRTVDVLRRVHKENEERKMIIEQLLQQKPNNAVPRMLGVNLNASAPSPENPNTDVLHHFAGLASLPHLRAEHIAHLPTYGVAPYLQQSCNGSNGNSFGNVDILTFANPQMQSFTRYPGAPDHQATHHGQPQASAILLDQLVAERDAIARARVQYTTPSTSASSSSHQK